jgi:putative endonuclease
MSKDKRYPGYMMASRLPTLSTGVTEDLYHRALPHKRGEMEGFTRKYNINRVAHYETFTYVTNAIARGKQIKARIKRIARIKSMNPTWQDLAEGRGNPAELPTPRFARDGNPSDAQPANQGGTGATEAAPLPDTKTKIA